MRSTFAGLLSTCSLLSGCGTAPAPDPVPESGAAQFTVEIVRTLPGDPGSFTQGLEVSRRDPNELIVGTGWLGESRIYRRTMDGAEVASADLKATEFGEGIAQTTDAIWQLTWQNGVAYQRDPETLEVIGQASFPGEGWGLCALDASLYMSDGTESLRVLDSVTFAEKGRVATGVDKLNELECADGAIYANRFLTTEIVKLSPGGEVLGLIDASGLSNNATRDPNNVLNGIAHIPGTDRFYLTGKRWPDVYEVRFVPKS
ncbi:Glutamine cyclotransferase [Corynebacterium kalinowskii]|uniref:Glutamine cyclotransferase n=1 Tax=Corynebacterium kalinowskii TaxID=2675216 RepID=A0A6B8VHX2_9CORY|nr:glutaminyl-peptide cyclotransferase [Corynebacterium kalinowskii]QGU02609.1 Glutamine cyclotransferase [Corynebacterium kalinowskii]